MVDGRVSKNAVFGLNLLPGFWTRQISCIMPILTGFGPHSRGPKSGQEKLADLDTLEQKAANTALSQIRIFIEHAIGGMKRYNILVQVFRNRKANFEDDAVGICAGLWNFALSYSMVRTKIRRR